MKKTFTLFFLLAFTFGRGYSQCTNQVTNLSGTSLVNGVNVTVTPFGYSDVYTTYCVNTTPYFVGYKFSSGLSGTGGYTFTFSPPVNSLTLNFSGASNLVTYDQEVIKLYVNGSHYAMPAIGTTNGCDPMALLTSSGDLTGCANCGVSGWNGTTVSGSISTLTVLDTLEKGPDSGGTLFSLFICGAATTLPPVADLQASKTTICTNDCINFTDLSSNATAWTWTFDGAANSTSTSQNPQGICYQAAGTYSVTLIASNSGGSDTAVFNSYIHVMPSPATPVISQAGSILYCSTDPNYTSYQWFDSTVLIPGATDTMLVINHSGNYNVQVSNADSCKIAVGINVVLAGIKHFTQDKGIVIYPNPATNLLNIQTELHHPEETTVLSVMNVLGEILLEEQTRRNETNIDIKNLPAGLYFIQIKSERGSIVKKFVKE